MTVPADGAMADVDLDAIANDLHASVVSDALDALGERSHALPPELRPLDPGRRVVGFATTLEVVPAWNEPAVPYAGLIEAVDGLRPGSVLVMAVAGTARSGLWGELFSTAAQARGARGAVIHGPVRDRDRIVELGFPVFGVGSSPLDVRGRMEFHAADRPIEIGAVRVAPGDLVFGDTDGVVVVPRMLIGVTLERAYDKVRREREARHQLGRGGYLQSVWDRLGVL